VDLLADYVEILRDFSAPNGKVSASGAKELWLYVESVAGVHRQGERLARELRWTDPVSGAPFDGTDLQK
jgi:hypothetical protein